VSPSRVHASAIVDPEARLGAGVEIGPFAVIEPDVEIGPECEIGAHAVIKRYTRMGRGNRVHEHAVLGGTPQDLAFQGVVSRIDIGDDNTIREGVTLHRATREGHATRIGDRCFLMAYSHVAHDCTVGDQVILANGACLGGHVSVGERAFLSAASAVHQFCRIGRLCMVSGLAGVNLDCLPFTMVAGNPARVVGLNRVGLERAGMDPEAIAELKRAFHRLFSQPGAMRESVEALSEWPSPLVREWVDFIRGSTRGFARNRP
jgi:UDP-N-acetylglucosamine acyltransferase